jgi:nucleotidyltransferase substrate binding protein (TIGR01987 family)
LNAAARLPPLDLGALRSAVGSLTSSMALEGAPLFDAQPSALGNLLRAGLVQHFEFCFELAVRMLKRELERETEDRQALDAMSWRDMVRFAAERGLIDSPAAWFGFRELRNITSHTYDRAKANLVLAACEPLLQHCRNLLSRLEARNHG